MELLIRRLFFLTILAASPYALLAQGPSLGGCPVFPADNVWNTRVDNLPVDANSAAYVNSIGSSSKLHPDYGAGGGTPYTFVTGDQPKVSVSFRYVSDAGPYPIPGNVAIEGASDHHALIVDTTNCILYELFSLDQRPDGSWEAGSGAIWNLNSNALRPDGWTSADAAGLPLLPGLIRYDEVISGQINHAIRFTAPHTRNAYIWPARHYASSLTGQQYPQMGQRFRLKANFDMSAFPHNVQVILQAMKTYGIILADNGAPWFVQGVGDSRWNDDEMHQLTHVLGDSFEAVDESSLMVDYNSGQAAGSAPQPTGLPSGWVNIVSKNSGKCLDMIGGPTATWPGDFAQQWTCVGGLNQEFQFTAVNGGYKITARHSGLQLDVSGGPSSVANNVLILQWPYWGGSNEIWNATPTSDGYYNIIPLNSHRCLDVRGASQNDGAAIQQWTCWGGDNQKWSFVPAS
ncbi:MAG: RICIN domain-containing protein [Acidobacteriota bacterium]|nr:RICIN domain-containing protein [Acidobacteriota bacterium]